MAGWLKRDLEITEWTALIVAVVLIGVRLALPDILKTQINHRLERLNGYAGHVDDVGVHVWHGGYSMAGLDIEKKSAAGNEPLIVAKDISFTLDYHELFHGKFVSDVIVTNGIMNFKRSPTAQQSQDLGRAPQSAKAVPQPGEQWQSVVQDLFPIRITYLQLVNCRIHYVDAVEKPKVDLSVDNLNLEATGLRNRPSERHTPFPATITASGDTIGRGHVRLSMQLEPLAKEPHFQLSVSLEDVSLPSLNPYLLAHANLSVSHGDMWLYMQMDAQGGGYSGYVKPIFTDLNFHTPEDNHKPLEAIWKDIASAFARLMRDKDRKQVATIVNFKGDIEQTANIDVGKAIAELFRNGFIQALRRGLEGNGSGKKAASTS